jgi:hypothetical protein
MHNYSLDRDERLTKIIYAVFILTVIATLAIYAVHEIVGPRFGDSPVALAIYVLLDLFSAPVLFVVLLRWYDLIGWKKRLPIPCDVPIFAGVWHGTLIHGEQPVDHLDRKETVSVHINQSWLKIEVRFESERGWSSTSYAAFVSGVRGANGSLLYCYRRRRLDGSEIYLGTGELILTDKTILNGHYYAGGSSEKYGSLELRRVDSVTKSASKPTASSPQA